MTHEGGNKNPCTCVVLFMYIVVIPWYSYNYLQGSKGRQQFFMLLLICDM